MYSPTEFKRKWTINDWSQRWNTMDRIIESSTFSVGRNNDIKWNFRLYPKGCNEKSTDHLSIFLNLVSCNQNEVLAKYKFSILNAEGKETAVMDYQYLKNSNKVELGASKNSFVATFLSIKLTFCCRTS